MPSAATQTPMMQQYLELKKQCPDAILFFRLGDFYEMFQDDAVRAAPVLEVQLTSRDRNSDNPMPMCGVPYHAASTYVQKLVSKGFKVAICEQFEEAVPGKPGKTSIRRDITRIVTPSLIGDPELVSEATQNLLVAFHADGETLGVAAVDLLGGRQYSGEISVEKVLDFISRWRPKEILVKNLESDWTTKIRRHYSHILISERPNYFTGDGALSAARKATALYLEETQKISLAGALSAYEPLFIENEMRLDATALSALEILESNSRLEEGPSLFSTLDRTSTSMGRRTLKDWLRRPLGNLESIQARHNVVSYFLANIFRTEALRKSLSSLRDLERLATKTALGLSLPRDLVAVREIQKAIPGIISELKESGQPELIAYANRLAPLETLTHLLESALEDEPPVTLRDGGIIREAFHPEIGELRTLSRDTKGAIAQMESREKEATGISSLKIKYSRVFGYTIEVTAAHLKKVPEHYTRKQTIANGERFVTTELKQFEEKVVTAEQRLHTLEERLFLDIRGQVASQVESLHSNARALGELDVLISFARVAEESGYCRPEVHTGWNLEIVEGRHPVVEKVLPAGEFVPNSLVFNQEDSRTWIITGPNMAGKSTIMRQVALTVLMAQVGSFVPAKSALIPLVDSIYTRIGSSDDLAGGRSTFMVEMTEVAEILEQATSRSLIVIDEIGRGTSTYDGLSLAWSLLEYLHTEIAAKVLFATHFVEVTALEKTLRGLKNSHVMVDRWKEEIVFLHKLGPGICQRSYGIEVAKLAGLPSKVLLRGREILGVLESQSQKAGRNRSHALDLGGNQLAFFDLPTNPESRAHIEN